jgi:acetyl-CoA C-acetyltransferase
VKALQVVTAPGEKLEHRNHYRAHLDTTHRAAILAYEEAGISKPREEISMLETHDCCSISELLHYEDLMISPYGKAIDDLDSGFYDLDGKIPCQPDGGFKCFGDSIGASAIRMIYEIYKQLQGNVDSNRQVRNPRIGLAHHLSGNPFTSAVSITILSDEL